MDEQILTDVEPKVEETKEETDKQQTETAEDSSTTEQTETTTPSQEGESTPNGENNTLDEEKLPFHKHPRWKAMYQENQELKKVVEDLSVFKEQLSPLAQAIQSQQVTPIPEWFKNTYGDDPALYNQYLSEDKKHRDEIKAEVLAEIKAEQEQATQETQKWNSWVDEQMSSMEKDGLKFNRNELQKFMVDWQSQYNTLPLDPEGNIDFRKSLELMNKINPPTDNQAKVEAKKQIASKIASTTGSESKSKSVFELGKIPTDWRDATR